MTLPVEVVVGRAQPRDRMLYSPSEIALYGVQLGALQALIGTQVRPVEAEVTVITQGDARYVAALIYAFAYQGHCYHLPEPVILMLPENDGPAEGYGFNPAHFRMWRVDKLDRSLQLETTADTFEEIVLKRYLAGTKQPLAYASRAQISHRGGKLSE